MTAVEVFGMDLSITAAGLAPSADLTEVVGGGAKDGDARLVLIRNRVRRWLRVRHYDLAVIEGPGFASTRIFAVAMVHGVVRAELVVAEVPYVEVAPNGLHAFATGNGGASKTEMIQAAEGLAGRKFHSDGEADAWWLRRMGLAALGDHDGLTPDQIERLGRVMWPAPVRMFGALPTPKSDVARCKHLLYCLRSGDHWLHPSLTVCDKPPK